MPRDFATISSPIRTWHRRILGSRRREPTCPPRAPHGASLALETVTHLQLLPDTPSRVTAVPFRTRLALVLQVSALASSMSDSLRQGSGTGLAPISAHLRSPGHASHTPRPRRRQRQRGRARGRARARGRRRPFRCKKNLRNGNPSTFISKF